MESPVEMCDRGTSIGLHAAHPEACQTKTIPVVDNVMRVYIMCVS